MAVVRPLRKHSTPKVGMEDVEMLLSKHTKMLALGYSSLALIAGCTAAEVEESMGETESALENPLSAPAMSYPQDGQRLTLGGKVMDILRAAHRTMDTAEIAAAVGYTEATKETVTDSVKQTLHRYEKKGRVVKVVSGTGGTNRSGWGLPTFRSAPPSGPDTEPQP